MNRKFISVKIFRMKDGYTTVTRSKLVCMGLGEGISLMFHK